ncbi:MAG: sulfotransferase [Candidatus Dormibacteria bacterium]
MTGKASRDGAAPIFVVCCSRSGSTLLRYILDTHPLVACPPELHVAQLCRRLLRLSPQRVEAGEAVTM